MTSHAQFAPATLARRYLDTHKFMDLYRDVMKVVEATANYLDTQGRVERQVLNRPQELLYSKASMQLTTQLMQIAGHALVLRDVAERKLDLDEALTKIVESRVDRSAENNLALITDLPKGFIDLCEAANRLRSRLLWVHEGLTKEQIEPVPVTNMVHNSLEALRQAFA
jgi:regulator of CtrA degradation